jgi:threonyl-tRNA synthetase
MLQVQLPDGKILECADSASALDVAMQIGPRLAKATVAARIGDRTVDATRPLAGFTDQRPVPLRLLTDRDPESLDVLRHSCAHVMARAVMRLFPDVSLAFGPTIAGGYYYDFELKHKLSEDDFAAIESEMASIVAKEEPFEQFSLNRDEATQLCNDLKQSLKVEHIETGLAEHNQLGFYRQGEFVDLCRGPHIPHAGHIKAFKLMSVAGAYWKGDSSGRQLQRLYGTAWFSPKDMQAYLDQIEEARRRDIESSAKNSACSISLRTLAKAFACGYRKVLEFVFYWKTSYVANCCNAATNPSTHLTSAASNFTRPVDTSPTIAIANSHHFSPRKPVD